MAKKSNPPGEKKSKPRLYHRLHPWRCEQRGGQCVVSGCVEATGVWQTVAVISGTADTFSGIVQLVELVNGRRDNAGLQRLAFEALKAVEQEGLTYATEMELEHAIERLEKRGPKGA